MNYIGVSMELAVGVPGRMHFEHARQGEFAIRERLTGSGQIEVLDEIVRREGFYSIATSSARSCRVRSMRLITRRAGSRKWLGAT